MSGTNPPLNENFEFLKMMIFNLFFLWKIWKYVSDFFKVHVKGVLKPCMRHARAHMRAHACMRIFQLMTPSICTLKNSEKYFQIFHKKIKLKIIIFKNSKFSFKGGFVPDIFSGATALKWF